MHRGARPPVVVIGRNEGEDLRRCLCSALRQTETVVYVDSGSDDGSPDLARSLGAIVVELDAALPYTAARGRNEGVQVLLGQKPGLATIQFLDGDCELADGWLDFAAGELENRPGLAAVCGRRRERHASLTVFNRLCDLDWDAPPGETNSFGGDAMVRVAAFTQAGGFNAALIAGEDPDLSLRMRQKGWKILRSDREMSLHDAKMSSFGQWWRRTVRSGHAYAEGAWLHGLGPDRHWLRESLSGWFWGAVLPLAVLTSAWPTGGRSLALLSLYPVLGLRIYRHKRRQGLTPRYALLYASFCVLAKFPEAQGQILFHGRRCAGRPGRLIEYKFT